MRHWLWIPAALAAGCFSEPVEPEASGGTDPDASTGSQTTNGTDPSVGESGGSSSSGDATDPTVASAGSSETTDGTGETTASDPVCGNGEVEGNEHCDGEDPQGAACLDDCTISCLGPFRDCDEIPSGGCEINTQDDGNNCGACGHVCASGECINAACAPAAVADGTGPGPGRITRVEDTFVFDESGFGRILRWDLGEEWATELVADDLTGGFRRFAVAADSVLWLDYNAGAAQRVPLAGGAVDFMFAVADAGSPYATATHVYYPTTEVVDLVQVSTLLEATQASPAITTAVASTVPGVMCQVVEAGGRIVWTGTDPVNPVRSVPPGGGAIQSHAVRSTDACNRPVFGVGSFIYLYGQAIEGGPFGLIRHNVTNGMSSMLIQEPGIGTLGDYYVSSHGIVADVEGEVRVYDLMGDNPVFVAEISANSAGRYLDDQVVMWTDIQNNTWTLYVNERP